MASIGLGAGNGVLLLWLKLMFEVHVWSLCGVEFRLLAKCQDED